MVTHHAAAGGSLKTLHFLLNKTSVDVGAKNKAGDDAEDVALKHVASKPSMQPIIGNMHS